MSHSIYSFDKVQKCLSLSIIFQVYSERNISLFLNYVISTLANNCEDLAEYNYASIVQKGLLFTEESCDLFMGVVVFFSVQKESFLLTRSRVWFISFHANIASVFILWYHQFRFKIGFLKSASFSYWKGQNGAFNRIHNAWDLSTFLQQC